MPNVDDVLLLAEISPVLVSRKNEFKFKNAIKLPAKISSKELGAVNTQGGVQMPMWYDRVLEKKYSTIIIDGIDLIDEYKQEKFYELLKYKTISSIEFPFNVKIVLLYDDIKKVSKSITALCQIVE